MPHKRGYFNWFNVIEIKASFNSLQCSLTINNTCHWAKRYNYIYAGLWEISRYIQVHMSDLITRASQASRTFDIIFIHIELYDGPKWYLSNIDFTEDSTCILLAMIYIASGNNFFIFTKFILLYIMNWMI